MAAKWVLYCHAACQVASYMQWAEITKGKEEKWATKWPLEAMQFCHVALGGNNKRKGKKNLTAKWFHALIMRPSGHLMVDNPRIGA